jgi:hypothetical protein
VKEIRRLFALVLVAILLVELLYHTPTDHPALLNVVRSGARFQANTTGGRFVVPLSNIILLNNIILVKCGQDLSEKGKPFR